MKLKWIKISKAVSAEGTTIAYAAVGTPLTIESRKRHIPHANNQGTWDHTAYFVIKDGEEVMEKQHLADAKQYAEELWRDMKDEPVG